MTELLYQAARRLARKYLEESWDGTASPVHLEPIARTLNAKVLHTPLSSQLSGLVVKKASEQHASILVNSSEPALRQRFTLAHELGHIVERKDIAGDDSYSFEEFRGMKYDAHEFFADEFAGALLMPESVIGDIDLVTPEQVARTFNVTVAAARKRLERLRVAKS